MYLSANAYAAQQPTRKYINKVRDIAKQIEKSVPEFSTISLTEFFSDNIIDSIFEKTEGGTKELEMDMFVDTLEDVSFEEARKQKELTAIAEKERDEERRINLKQQKAIIYDAVNRNKNTMDLKDKFRIIFILSWEWFTVPIFALIAYLMSKIESALSLPTQIMLLIVVLMALAEKFFTSNAIKVWLLKKSYSGIENSYKMKITRNLGVSDKMYCGEIIEIVFADDKFIQRCKRILKEE